MKKSQLYRLLLIFSLMATIPFNLKATHIIGGEINYRCLGGNYYEITLQLFRDCDTGVPWFEDPAVIEIRNSNNVLLDTIGMRLRNNDTLDFSASACSVIPPSACIHTTTYREVRFLAYQPGGYHFSYEICCRNQDIINIVDPTGTRAAYHAYISQEALLTCNNGAHFNDWPPFYICNGQALNIDHSATDADGDVIVYSLCTPYDQLNIPVTWQPPYQLGNMLGGPLPFSINSVTGQLSGTPFTNGTFVVGICASEYRNGNLISTTRRDFQFIVTPCVSSVLADFETIIPPCNDNLDITFNNLSNPINGPFLWDFGDGSPTTDVVHPVHPYPDTGWYSVMLISGLGTPCEDTIIKDIHVLIEQADIDVTSTPAICNDELILLVAHNVFQDYNQITNYTWSPAGNIVSGQGTDSVWVQVAGNSFSIIVVATNSFGCQDQVQLTQLNIPIDTVIADFNSVETDCNQSLTMPFMNQSVASNNQYLWNFDNLGSSTDFSPSYTFPDTGTYTITLIAGVGQACQDTIVQKVYIPLSGVSIEASDSLITCRKDTVLLTASSLQQDIYPIVDFEWSPADNIISGQGTDSVLVFADSDIYFTVIATNSENCKDTTYTSINVSSISPVLTIDATPDEIYVGQTSQILANYDADYTYDWIPDSTLNHWDINNPLAKPRVTRTYYLNVANSFGCALFDSIQITVLPPTCDNPVVFVPSAFTPDQDGHNDEVLVHGNNVETMTFVIYNRWGQKVFETQDQSIGWDGTFKGKAMPPDVYGYYMQCTCDEGGTLLLKGNITLLR